MPTHYPEQEKIIRMIVAEIDACEGDPVAMDATYRDWYPIIQKKKGIGGD